jgi:hypothetical protein
MDAVVATGGGDTINFVDCSMKKVVQRYTHPDEEFYAMAWAVIPSRGGGMDAGTNR